MASHQGHAALPLVACFEWPTAVEHVIPPSFIQDVLARTDVAELVGRYVTLKKAGINFKGLCPFHGEKSPSFIVSPSRQTYHCFGCGVHGNALGFLMEYSGLGFVDAVKELAHSLGMSVPQDNLPAAEVERQRQEKDHRSTLVDTLSRAAGHWKQQLKQSPRAIAYLKGRGLSGAIAARFALGYAPAGWRGLASVYPDYQDPILVESGLVISIDDEASGVSQGDERAASAEDARPAGKRYDRFRDRIMFPIRNAQGEVIGFGGRVLDRGEPKYLNSPETPVFVKGRELYGLHEARAALRKQGYALVTEGYMDVVALAQWGFENAVATLGTACTAEHVQKLLRFTDDIVFSFDGDAAGRRAAGRALEACLPFASDTRRFRFLFLPAQHDPDSYIRDEGAQAFGEMVRLATPLSKQLIEHAGGDGDLNAAEDRAKLLTQAVALLAKLPAGSLAGLIADELAAAARTSSAEVQRRLDAHRQAMEAAQAAQLERQLGEPRARPQAGAAAPGAPRRGAAQATPAPLANELPWPEHEASSAELQYAQWAAQAQPGWGAGGAAAGHHGSHGQSPAHSSQRHEGGWRNKDREQGSSANSRWRSRARPALVLPLPATVTPLDRIVWVLIAHAGCWDQLSADTHDLLCAQPQPYGEFFRWLERVLQEQGPLPADVLCERMGAAQAAAQTPSMDEPAALAVLARRINKLHEVVHAGDPVEELIQMVRPLELDALREELDLLLQSGELSEQAEARKRELVRLTQALKREISQHRPISG